MGQAAEGRAAEQDRPRHAYQNHGQPHPGTRMTYTPRHSNDAHVPWTTRPSIQLITTSPPHTQAAALPAAPAHLGELHDAAHRRLRIGHHLQQRGRGRRASQQGCAALCYCGLARSKARCMVLQHLPTNSPRGAATPTHHRCYVSQSGMADRSAHHNEIHAQRASLHQRILR